MSATSPPLRIAVVGGGIAGLTTALAIWKKKQEGANIQLDVYEQAERFGEVGAGVAFGPNAQRALRLIGVGEALDAVAGPAGEDADLWFDFRVTGKDAARGSVHRADFLEQLVKRLPEGLAHFHHRATSYTPHENGVTVHFEKAGQKPAEADVLIASDGIKSLLRGCLYRRKGADLAQQKARYSEWVAYRGLISRDKYHDAFGKGTNDKIMHCGKGRHILTFPVRNGELINIVGFVHDPKHEKLGSHDGPWSEPRPKEEMLADYAPFNDECKRLLSAIEKPSLWGIFDLPPIEHAVDDRVVIIGDAAHGTTPHQGAGAGQAVEDSLFLAALLAHPSVANSSPSARSSAIARALNIYQTERHPRAQKVQVTSREAGKLYEFLDPDAGDDLGQIKKNLEARMDWIWSFDTEKELERVTELLDEAK
ncbi:hypothetical protein JCM10213v2_008233 [Rhodosporidiobolus nylandii]